MDLEFTVLSTPRARQLLESDMRVYAIVSSKIECLMAEGLPECAQRDGRCLFLLGGTPPVSLNYLSVLSTRLEHFLIVSGPKDGLGPTESDLATAAKGVFPTIDQIRDGLWSPLERIFLA